MRKMVAVAVLLVLTGCSATEPVDVEGALENIESKDEHAADESEPAASGEVDQPIQAVENPEPEPTTPEEQYLAAIREIRDNSTFEAASDAQLLASAKEACEQLSVNPSIDEVRLVEGEVENERGRFYDSMTIAYHANAAFCPEVTLTRSPPAP